MRSRRARGGGKWTRINLKNRLFQRFDHHSRPADRLHRLTSAQDQILRVPIAGDPDATAVAEDPCAGPDTGAEYPPPFEPSGDRQQVLDLAKPQTRKPPSGQACGLDRLHAWRLARSVGSRNPQSAGFLTCTETRIFSSVQVRFVGICVFSLNGPTGKRTPWKRSSSHLSTDRSRSAWRR